MIFFLIILLQTTGCTQLSSTQRSLDISPVLINEKFVSPKPITIEDKSTIFILHDEALNFVSKRLMPISDDSERMKQLVRYIFDRTDFNLLYSSSANTNASDTFDKRAANCLSLTIMTYALAEAAELNISFQEIIIPEYWTRQNGYSALNGHVNLKFSRANRPGRSAIAAPSIEVDFDPLSPKEQFPTRIISKQRVIAMFYNNKAAQALVDKNFARAFAYLKASFEADNFFIPSWNNLGVLYRLTGNTSLAEKTYKMALQINPNNLQLQENLAILYESTGRIVEHQQLMAEVEQKRASNPYYHFNLGQEANEQGKHKLAIKHFFNAVSLDDEQHEFYYGIAKSYAAIGDISSTKRFLRKAERSVSFDDWKQHYRNKLSMLAKS